MSDIKNVVLVHGGFVDGSGWEGVHRYRPRSNDGSGWRAQVWRASD